MWKPIILDVECIVCNKTLQKIKHDPSEISRKMGKITNRRSRTPNWSLEEKQYLLELIKQHKEVVVTKTNNGPNHSEEKDVAWNEILRQLAHKFGEKFSGFSIKKVKTQWQNMKRIAREELTLVNGTAIQQCTKQSLEVCNILDLVKDGVLKKESDRLNETTLSTNIEIKTECIDEDITELDESSIEMNERPENLQEKNDTATLESSESSVSEQNHLGDGENSEGLDNRNNTRSSFAMTDTPYLDNSLNSTLLHREFQEFIKYSATEKQMKMESLKEEQQIVRAMRETAELNKIIAEQKLKHILWIKKREMAMYSGEPGSGAGKGGGGGGAIREAGGAFGKMEAAREDEYFYKKQKEQLANIKGHLDKEISFHQEQIKRHEDAIRRHKEQMAEINDQSK